MKIVHDEHVAEGITADAIVRATERVLVDRPTYFLAWLQGIARNMAFHWRRHLKVHEKSVVDFHGKMERSAFAETISREALDLFDRGLRELTKNQRRALLMSVVDQMSCGEIGDRLNLKSTAVRSLLFRARSSLAGWIGYMHAL